jgi:hypothetical protein
MMTRSVQCKCGGQINVADEELGQRKKCPECGEHVLVNDSSQPTTSPLMPPSLPPTLPPPVPETAHGHVDARPILSRNQANAVSHAESIRDRIYAYFQIACKRENIEAQILKSRPYGADVWVRVECWLPHQHDAALTFRSRADVKIRPMEFHRFDYELDLELSYARKSRSFGAIIDFRQEDATKIVQSLIRRTRRLKRRHFRRCRSFFLQFWLPRNKVVRLRPDIWRVVAQVSLVIGILTLPLYCVGILVLLAAGGIFIWRAIVQYRTNYVISNGKPFQEPRILLNVDSWQTIVYELGHMHQEIRESMIQEMRRSKEEAFHVEDEHVWALGVDGKEEREQLVVRLRRGIAFVHLYEYASDLYIGWDGNVNAGTWVEKDVGQGIDPQTGAFARICSIQAGWHVPTEYDITDTNCVIEWVHGAMKKVVERAMKEHKIDQEIDFQIIRGERQGIAGKADPDKKKPMSRVKSIFQRAK